MSWFIIVVCVTIAASMLMAGYNKRQLPPAQETFTLSVGATVVGPIECELCRESHYGSTCPWEELQKAEFNRTMKQSLPLPLDERAVKYIDGQRFVVWGFRYPQAMWIRRDGEDGYDQYGRKLSDMEKGVMQ